MTDIDLGALFDKLRSHGAEVDLVPFAKGSLGHLELAEACNTLSSELDRLYRIEDAAKAWRVANKRLAAFYDRCPYPLESLKEENVLTAAIDEAGDALEAALEAKP